MQKKGQKNPVIDVYKVRSLSDYVIPAAAWSIFIIIGVVFFSFLIHAEDRVAAADFKKAKQSNAAPHVFSAQPSLAKTYDPQTGGQIGTTFLPIRAGGVKQGCSLVFTALIYDHIYKKGGLLPVTGNVSYQEIKEQPFITLKVVLADDEGKPPFFAYLESASGTTMSDVRGEGPSDATGGKLFLINLNEKPQGVLGDIMTGEPITLFFNREKDGMDVQLPLDFTLVADDAFQQTHSQEPTQQFSKCVVEMINELEAKLKGRTNAND